MKKDIAFIVCLVIVLAGCVIKFDTPDDKNGTTPEGYGALQLIVTLESADDPEEPFKVENVAKMEIEGEYHDGSADPISKVVFINASEDDNEITEKNINFTDLKAGSWEFEVAVYPKEDSSSGLTCWGRHSENILIKADETTTSTITIKLGHEGEPTSLNRR